MEYQAREDAKRAAQTSTEAPELSPTPPVAPSVHQFDPVLIPDVDSSRERSEEELELDRILKGIGIIEAYNRWCGKMTPVITSGRTEGIKISCPIPGHRDSNPSAWANTENNTWVCGPCGMQGGDIYDIAAYHHGLPVPDYKRGALFHKLRRAMGEDLGYSFKEKLGGGYDLVPPVVVSTPAPPPPVLAPQQASLPAPHQAVLPPVPPTGSHLSLVPQIPLAEPVQAPEEVDQPADNSVAQVISIDPEVDAYDPELDSESYSLSFDWREALAGYEETFLYKWCDATSLDYSPEEYHFFSGLMLLGLAVGRDTLMADGTRPVMPNLAICYLGRTGSGKSTAQAFVSRALNFAMPENDLGILVEGVREVGEVASGEALIGEFQQIVKGSATGHVPIRGYVEFSELSGLLAKSSVQGSTLKTKIMDFIDGKPKISNSSQTHGRKVAYNAFAAFSTSSQPRALRKLLDGQDSASGYLNRWLYVAGPSKPRDDYFNDTNVNLRPAELILNGIHIAHLKKNPTDPPVVVGVTDSARAEFKRFFRPIEAMLKITDDDMLSRLEIHYKKLMFCHAINRRALFADIQDVLFVERLHPYVLATFKLVGAQIGKSQQQEFIDRIFNYIRRKELEMGRGPTRTQIRDAFKTKNIGDKQVNDALKQLMDADQVEPFKLATGTRGRPPQGYQSVKHA
jgi:hypothetical protein